MTSQQTRLFAALLTLAVAAVPAGAFAQSAPDSPPSYSSQAQSQAQPADQPQVIHGQIASFDGAANLQVNDDQGYVDNVQLQPDTIVNASNAQLQPGATVTVVGVGRGNVFVASRVDAGNQAPVPQAVTGTVVNGVLSTALDSKNAYVGEPVTLSNVTSSDGSINGATLYGTVTDVTPAGQGRNAQVQMHFDSLKLPNGPTQRVDGVVTSVNVQTKNNAAKEAGGALLGMLAGNAIAKTLFGVSGGGILGAIGGYFVAKDNRADVVIPANSAVTVQLVGQRRQAN